MHLSLILSIYAIQSDTYGQLITISSILCGLTSKLHTEKHDTFHFKWVETVKSTLDNTVFSTIWENQYIDVAKFKSCFV